MFKKEWGYRNVVDKNYPMDYYRMRENIEALKIRFPFLGHTSIGKSYIGKDLDVLTIGTGEKKVIYIGSHHGMEWITTLLLMKFTEELCKSASYHEKSGGVDIDYLLEMRTIIIVPMLNPDGVELSLGGVGRNNPVASRLFAMNGGSDDFTRWQANARGVDLNHNYNANSAKLREIEIATGITEPGPTRFGGDHPESEPETSALTSYIRKTDGIMSLTALHTQGEEIYWRYGDYDPPKARSLAAMLARETGYSLGDPLEQIASYGGCKDWFIEEFNRPGFTIECGKGENPLPLADMGEIYMKIAPPLIQLALLS
ncbi:hypothetical protein FACS1894219_08910 [Clostridia bacterium]|nr:hypothetical protein FACS1894219_08910 [Clostridia bacterium]